MLASIEGFFCSNFCVHNSHFEITSVFSYPKIFDYINLAEYFLECYTVMQMFESMLDLRWQKYISTNTDPVSLY